MVSHRPPAERPAKDSAGSSSFEDETSAPPSSAFSELSAPPDSSVDSGELSSRAPAVQSDGSIAWRVGGLLMSLRPHQWVKNVFVLAPVVFAKEVFDPVLLTHAAAAFSVFCLLASAVYTLNDLADVEADRLHPVKRHRPIASGRLPIPAARVLAVVLVLVALGGAMLLTTAFFVVALAYLVNNLAYSFKVKHIAYLDVLSISAGFVMRVLAGGYGTQTPVSNYLLLCTALLAGFLGFGKRRHELAAAGKSKKQRLALKQYRRRGLDLALWITAIATIATYLAYTLDSRTRGYFQSDYLWVSTVFVVLGVARFVTLVRSRPRAESPTQEMLKDGPFVGTVLLWVILVMWMVYHLRPS